MDPQRFCVRWNSYKSNLQTAFPKLLTSEHFVDVTLACEKQFIKCHKIVLSACSVYFETLLVNNPCQHPIIFMKDVEFWEIKALVEFMYKGEVNVSQNQLDSLLKSAESLQIRGLSGTKQFVNFENNDDAPEESINESKIRKNKSDNEEEEEMYKRKKRKREENDKTVKNEESSDEMGKEEDRQKDDDTFIKEEVIEQQDYDYDHVYMNPGEDHGEDPESFSRDDFYEQTNSMPGPSKMPEFRSVGGLPNLHDYAAVAPEKIHLSTPKMNLTNFLKLAKSSEQFASLKKQSARKSTYKQYTMANMRDALERIEQGLSVYRASMEYGVPRKTLRNWMKKYNIKSSFDLRRQEKSTILHSGKNQTRHQEHNYTNPSKDDEIPQETRTTPTPRIDVKDETSLLEVQKTKISGTKGGNNSQQKGEISSRHATQSNMGVSPERQSLEVKSKTNKKDAFNRIRRSEEELRKAADMVRNGMTFQTTSDTFNIPISTIRFYMARRGILPQRRRGRGSSGVRDDDFMHPPFEIIHYRLPDIDKPV